MKKAFSILLFILCFFISARSENPIFTNAPDPNAPKVSILGDSYSTFEGYIEPSTNEMWYFKNGRDNNDVDKVEQSWWYILLNETGYNLCANNSYSGSTISYKGYRGEDYKDRSFITRCGNLGQPEIILVFGATNDSWAGVPVGEYKTDNISEADLYTFRPAMETLLKEMTQKYDHSKIYFIINSELRDEIVESVNTICLRYDIPTIQLHDIDKQAGHPSIQGMQQIASQIKPHITASDQ